MQERTERPASSAVELRPEMDGKVFNNIASWHLASLARPAGAPDRSALPIAGDDSAAKAAVTRFLDAIGYDTVDAGMLGSGGRFQFGTRAFVAPYGGLSDLWGTRGWHGGHMRRPRRLTISPRPTSSRITIRGCGVPVGAPTEKVLKTCRAAPDDIPFRSAAAQW